MSALLVVALATTLATTMIWREDLWLHQVQTRRDYAQARLIAIAGIDWARAVLAADVSQYDHASEPWATKVPAIPAEGGEVGGEMTDESSKWNLNNLIGGKADELEVFKRLLASLQLPPELASAVADWIDPAKEASAGGAEDAYYLALMPPYRAANRQMTDVDNLLQVRGFDAAAVERLRPYVTALPGYNPVNVNTASATVIAAELPSLSASEVPQIIASRDRIPLSSTNDIRNRLSSPQAVSQDDLNRLGVASRFFTANIHARFGNTDLNCVALLQKQTPSWPNIVWLKFQ